MTWTKALYILMDGVSTLLSLAASGSKVGGEPFTAIMKVFDSADPTTSASDVSEIS